MSETTNTPSEHIAELRAAVTYKLGRCLLVLQQCERLQKTLVAFTELSGPADQLHHLRDQRVASPHKQTMGTLVRKLSESFLSSTLQQEEKSLADTDANDQAWFSVRYKMELPAEHHEAAVATLKELVDLRNELVHHFIERFDLWSEAGCQTADGFLEQSYRTIKQRYLTMQSWVKNLSEVQTKFASLLQNQAFSDLLDGLCAQRPATGTGSEIAHCLCAAELALAEDGWTRLDAAIRWMGNTYPGQTPKRYGFSSWRHTLHEIRQFETRKSQAGNKPTVIWYRSKAK